MGGGDAQGGALRRARGVHPHRLRAEPVGRSARQPAAPIPARDGRQGGERPAVPRLDRSRRPGGHHLPRADERRGAWSHQPRRSRIPCLRRPSRPRSAACSGRPTVLPVPGLAVKALLGEMGEETLLSGQRARPERAEETGYRFLYEDLEGVAQAQAGAISVLSPRQQIACSCSARCGELCPLDLETGTRDRFSTEFPTSLSTSSACFSEWSVSN